MSLRLSTYYQVLAHWNRKINLTSLSDLDEAVDRLLLEPVAAAAYLPRSPELLDLGSGGGSPAVPLALALGTDHLVMVESRLRKAAFLREVLRELGISGSVETERFEDLIRRDALRSAFGLISVRAVRLDQTLFETLSALLRSAGSAALFGTSEADAPSVPAPLRRVAECQLLPASKSVLLVIQKD